MSNEGGRQRGLGIAEIRRLVERYLEEKGSIGPGTTFPQEIRVIQSLQTIYESALSSVSGPIQIGLRGTLVVETNAELSVKDEAYA
tara:strand:- start:6219 stop:6476 length:258 start_codon:yes stop_codon:yes gene_type:complete